MSTKVAGSAIKDGYKNVKVYLQGQPAWVKAGNAIYASKGNIAKGNIVLIDLRSKKKSEAGRIARSVTIPYDTLDDRLDDIPKKAPVVLYSDSQEEVSDALEDLRDEGYKKVALVAGNYAGWVKACGKTAKGPVTTDINWVRKLEKGEVGKADFMKAVSGADAGAVILDVRTTDEASTGETLTVTVRGERGGLEQTETVTVEVMEGEDDDGMASTAAEMRDKFIPWLAANHPEFGITSETEWTGTIVKPDIMVVMYYLFFSEDWEMGVSWHVTIPPHNWARIYIRHRFTEVTPSYAFEISSWSEEGEPHAIDLKDAFAESVWR